MIRRILFAVALGPILISITPSEAALADSPRLSLAPVRLHGYIGNDLQLSYELPCGSELFGLVTAKDQKGGLRVGAVVSRGDIVCTSLPEMRMMQADFITTVGFRVVSPMNVQEFKGSFKSIPVRDLRLVKSKQKDNGSSLQTVSETRCGQLVGTILRKTSETRLEVGYLEHFVQGQKAGDCHKSDHVRLVDAVRMRRGMKIASIPAETTDPDRMFQLRLAPIHSASLTKTESGHLSFNYTRKCNEAPVGHVLGARKPGPKKGRGTVEVGMLVAEYSAIKCQGSEKTAYRSKDTQLPKGWTPKNMPSTSVHEPLVLHAPSELAKTRKNVRRGLHVEYLSSCDKTVGVVYARSLRADAGDVLAIGVLGRKAQSQCKKQVTTSTVYEPFLAEKVDVTDLFPLRIAGSAKTAH